VPWPEFGQVTNSIPKSETVELLGSGMKQLGCLVLWVSNMFRGHRFDIEVYSLIIFTVVLKVLPF